MTPLHLSLLVEPLVHLVGGDDTVIHGAEPAGHDDADRAGVVEALDLIGEFHRDFEAFEFGAEGGALHGLGVVVHGAGSGGFDVVDLVAHAGDESFQAADALFAHAGLFGFVLLVG